MRYVWEVRVTGGDPGAVKTSIERSIAHLTAGKPVPDLSDYERLVWRDSTIVVSVSEPVVDGISMSILVDAELYAGDAADAAVMTGGFDTIVSDNLIETDGVVSVECSSHVDRR